MKISDWYLTAAATALACSAMTQAQDYQQVAEASPYGQSHIETVTVTAERRAENAQDVGIALSVLSADALKDRNITTVNDLQFAVPSFEAVPAFGSGQPEFRLRGVGFDDYGSNNSSTVGVYVDQVAYPIPASTQGALFDISRVEVLRGPQGTLYGRNTTGGAINFITNAPSDTLTAGATGDYSSHGEFKADGYISGPVGATMKYRLAATTDQGGTWQKNRDTGEDLGNKNTTAVRGKLEWTPTNVLDVMLEAHWGYDKSQPEGLYRFTDSSTYGLTADSNHSTKTGWGSSDVFASLLDMQTNSKPFHNSIDQGISVHVDADLGFAKLTSITSWTAMHRKEFNDWDASEAAIAGTYFNTDAAVGSQELRLSGEDGKLSWMVGGYFSHEEMGEIFLSDMMDSYGFVADTSYDQYVTSAAGFARAQYQLNDQWKLIGGLRFEHELRLQKNYVSAEITEVGGAPVDFSDPSNKSISASPVTGKVEAQYSPTQDVMFYASISRGVKSGGFSAYNTTNANSVTPFKAEKLMSYEGGFKSELLDNTLQLNGAVFYYDYRDQQVQSAIYTHEYGVIGAIVNASRSHIYGGELEATWHPTDALTITQSFGYKTGKFDKFDNFLDATASTTADASVYKSLKGRKVGFPPISYSGSISYDMLLDGFRVTPEMNYVFHDKREPLLLGNTFDINSYWLANASITIRPEDAPWEVTLYGKNIFNTGYDLERNYFISSVNIAMRGEPGTAGVRLSYHY